MKTKEQRIFHKDLRRVFDTPENLQFHVLNSFDSSFLFFSPHETRSLSARRHCPSRNDSNAR